MSKLNKKITQAIFAAVITHNLWVWLRCL